MAFSNVEKVATASEAKSTRLKVTTTGGTIRLPKPNSINFTAADFSFAKYAATYFHANVTGQHSKRALKRSLLPYDLPTDEYAAQAIWIMMLRFMGDMTEPNEIESFQTQSVMERLKLTLHNNTVNSKEFQEALSSTGRTPQQRLMHKTLKRKSKLPEMLRKVLYNSSAIEYYHELLNSRCSNMDKLHFIIGHGILCVNLRDEILAQICKQLTNNNNRTSIIKGWILLFLCIGCFPPSQLFEPYLRCFIHSGPTEYVPYCERRLERTLKNGSRTQPPAWLELQATRNRMPMILDIFLSDGSIKKLQVDAASTAQECIEQLATHLGLKDAFGFSIVIQLYDKIMSLGAGQEHILDAISNCEQYAKEQGNNEQKLTAWKLYLRKELFPPWYDPTADQLSTQLTYKQIARGLNTGEYRCRTEHDIAMLGALEYYAENGHIMHEELLRKCITDYVPVDLLAAGDRALDTWSSLIANAFHNNEYVRQRAPQQHAKEDICLFAHMTWPMHFSRYYEALRIAGPQLLTDHIIIAVNSGGVYYIDETEQVLAEVAYVEISAVYAEPSNNWSDIDLLHIDTVQKENFTFKCFESQDVVALLNYLIENLRLRSKYAIALKSYEPTTVQDDTVASELPLTSGDLIQFLPGIFGANVLDENNVLAQGTCNGFNGEFRTKNVQVLATLNKPSQKILQIYRENIRSAKELVKSMPNSKYDTKQRRRRHTLQRYAQMYFRSEISDTKNSQEHEELWRHTKKMLKAPLLKSLQYSETEFQSGLEMYRHILMYMGDIPQQKATNNTDIIFGAALEYEALRDELYCQLMKQLTENHFQQSEERGWDLMYLATGTTYPSVLVLKELIQFLSTCSHVLAAESLKRIKRTMTNGQRKRPPHAIEVEGIQQRCMHIYHKIYFPDSTVEAFEIESFTRATHLTETIVKRLNLNSSVGFSLFVNIGDKAFSVPNDEFIFDYISKLMQWLRQSVSPFAKEAQIQCKYQLYFMKKLWLNVMPGRERNADNIFHYPQELPKYLDGYYRVSEDVVKKFAALIYVLEYDGELAPLQRVHEVLPYIVPTDMIAIMKFHEWKRQIVNGVKELHEANLLDEMHLKRVFLEEIVKQETFGSTFFPAEQNNDKSLPSKIILAINRCGFHIIDPANKRILRSYDYNELNFWSSGNTYFHIRFGNMIGAAKLLCSTTQGFKIDDLLTSYLKYFNEKQ